MSGPILGGLAESRERLAFYAEHKVAPEVEVIGLGGVNDAYPEVRAGRVRYRYVDDVAVSAL